MYPRRRLFGCGSIRSRSWCPALSDLPTSTRAHGRRGYPGGDTRTHSEWRRCRSRRAAKGLDRRLRLGARQLVPCHTRLRSPLLAGFDDDLDLAHTRVIADPSIRAAAFVFHDNPEPVVVAECRTPDEPAGLDLLRACVRDSLLSLTADNIPAIAFDGHDTDPHFRPLLDELPATGEPLELLDWS